MTTFSDTPLTGREWLQKSGICISGLALASTLKEESSAAPSASEALILSGQKIANPGQNRKAREE